MNRRNFNVLAAVYPVGMWLDNPFKLTKLTLRDDWIHLSDECPENNGYKLEFKPIRHRYDENGKRKDSYFEHVIITPDDLELTNYNWLEFDGKDIEKEKRDLEESLIEKEILHKVHIRTRNKHKIIISYRGDWTIVQRALRILREGYSKRTGKLIL